MEINKNLSRLFYVEDITKLINEKHGSVSELKQFDLSGRNIHAEEYQRYFVHPMVTQDTKFTLTTTYPGLLTGAGYSHPALHDIDKNNKNDISDFQLGFSFDHTTGLPVIPGSSVKGILKSVFPQKMFKETEQRENRLSYVKEILRSIKPNAVEHINKDNWERIFFGEPPKRKHVFCDAYIEEIPEDGKIFEDDYITHHHDNPFKEPTPIRFLKIAPEIKILFQFVLYDYPHGVETPLLSKKDIAQVFRQIILDFGIGAKRNVGYGNFK